MSFSANAVEIPPDRLGDADELSRSPHPASQPPPHVSPPLRLRRRQPATRIVAPRGAELAALAGRGVSSPRCVVVHPGSTWKEWPCVPSGFWRHFSSVPPPR